ncbi:cAMP-regulated phosphoprotein 21 [Eucyclogobius newberryi]|uniref:cAMP-regulated phosphoprotein 21 n=1 Tax=Eucyclogobius newberryi TaxID=166745 RepID=UPI003B5CA12B
MTEILDSSDVVVMTPCAVTERSSPLPVLAYQQDEGECPSTYKKPDSNKHCNQVQPKKKVKAKGKLMRSAAVCEESPPIEEISPEEDISCSNDSDKSLCKMHNQEPKKSLPSKESSADYTDSTGIDLHQFIVDTLNSNPRERMMLLKLEQDMIDFITSNSPFKKFPPMSSYHRMLVHRVAAYFGMEHNVDQTGKSIIINKTSNTRIPEQRFLDEVQEDKRDEMNRWRVILKRDSSLDDQMQPRLHPLRERQSKSMEEREEEYQRVRDRIFNQCPNVNPEPQSTQEAHSETRAVEEYNPYAETQRRRQLFRGSRDNSSSSWTDSSRQSSFDTDCRYSSDPRPWSSTDSDSSYQWSSPSTKPQQTANSSWDTHGSITLFKLPPCGQHPSPPPIMEELAPNTNYIMENGIPPGSILVNPHTGQPFLNPDGTPAVYNPPDSQQPIRSQTQLRGSPPQQQMLQYSSLSYTSPQMLPVTPSQSFSTAIEDVSSQFAHVAVSCQPNPEAPPMYSHGQGYVYAAPPLPPPPLPKPPSYCQPSPQVPLYYYGQYPTSSQHSCRPGSPGPHVVSQTTHPTAGYTPAVGVQQSSGPQTMMGSYTSMAPHHCALVQGGVPVSYPQSKVMGTEGGYCCVVPPHHGTCHPPACTNLSAPAWSAQY